MGEDEHLEAAYEDRNGDPHGVGSPEWEEDEMDNVAYQGNCPFCGLEIDEYTCDGAWNNGGPDD